MRVMWTKESEGLWFGEIPATRDWHIRVGVQASIDGWGLWVTYQGTVIHISEHESRNEAMLAAEEALKRADKLRTPSFFPPSPGEDL